MAGWTPPREDQRLEIKNAFNVPLPPDQAWPVLMDIERIAPCLPGAQITEIVDDSAYKGAVAVRLGPVALTFNGTAKFVEIDDANHTAKVTASGRDAKGRGNAEARVDFSLTPEDGGSRVEIVTDLTLAGAVAQYGRGAGMISDLASQLIGQFATNLDAQLSAEGKTGSVGIQAPEDEADATTASPAPMPEAKPIAGFSLLLRVIWNAVKRMFGRA